jgi:hypothetical protein
MKVTIPVYCSRCLSSIEIDSNLYPKNGGQARVLLDALRTYMAFCPRDDINFLFELIEEFRKEQSKYGTI